MKLLNKIKSIITSAPIDPKAEYRKQVKFLLIEENYTANLTMDDEQIILQCFNANINQSFCAQIVIDHHSYAEPRF